MVGRGDKGAETAAAAPAQPQQPPQQKQTPPSASGAVTTGGSNLIFCDAVSVGEGGGGLEGLPEEEEIYPHEDRDDRDLADRRSSAAARATSDAANAATGVNDVFGDVERGGAASDNVNSGVPRGGGGGGSYAPFASGSSRAYHSSALASAQTGQGRQFESLVMRRTMKSVPDETEGISRARSTAYALYRAQPQSPQSVRVLTPEGKLRDIERELAAIAAGEQGAAAGGLMQANRRSIVINTPAHGAVGYSLNDPYLFSAKLHTAAARVQDTVRILKEARQAAAAEEAEAAEAGKDKEPSLRQRYRDWAAYAYQASPTSGTATSKRRFSTARDKAAAAAEAEALDAVAVADADADEAAAAFARHHSHHAHRASHTARVQQDAELCEEAAAEAEAMMLSSLPPRVQADSAEVDEVAKAGSTLFQRTRTLPQASGWDDLTDSQAEELRRGQ